MDHDITCMMMELWQAIHGQGIVMQEKMEGGFQTDTSISGNGQIGRREKMVMPVMAALRTYQTGNGTIGMIVVVDFIHMYGF